MGLLLMGRLLTLEGLQGLLCYRIERHLLSPHF
jgi:hypothetical protein